MKSRKFPLIYIAEDDAFYAEMLKKKIQDEHLGQVKVFENGKSLRNNLFKIPEIVLLDHHLGDYDGLQILKEIKGVYPQTEVVFLSAQEDMNVAVSALKYGAFDYIEKKEGGVHRAVEVTRKLFRLNHLSIQNERYKILAKVAIPIVLLTILSLASVIWGLA